MNLDRLAQLGPLVILAWLLWIGLFQDGWEAAFVGSLAVAWAWRER